MKLHHYHLFLQMSLNSHCKFPTLKVPASLQLKSNRKLRELASLCWKNVFRYAAHLRLKREVICFEASRREMMFVLCSPQFSNSRVPTTSPHTLPAVCCAKCVRGCTVTRPGRLSCSSLSLK